MNYRIPFTIIVLALFLIVGVQTVNASSELLYASHWNGTLSIVDAGTYGVINNYPVGGEGANWGIVANPAGTKVYVSDGQNNRIQVVNPATNLVERSISINYPTGLAISSDGDTLYACMFSDDKIAVIDLNTCTITAYITVGTSPWACALTNSGSELWVANYVGDTVSIVDTSSNTIITTIGSMSGPCDIVFSKDGSKAFILNDYKGTNNGFIRIYETATHNGLPTIMLDHQVSYGCIDIEPGNGHIWVGTFDGNVDGYDTIEFSKYMDIVLPATGYCVQDIRISESNKMFIGHGKTIHVYDLNSNSFAGNITVIDEPTKLEVFAPSDTSAIVAPQLVTFTAKTGYRTLAVTGLNVSVYNNITGTLLYSGVTDSSGTVNFILMPTTKYDLLFNQSPNINTWYYVTPTYTGYIVDIPFSQVIGLTKWSSEIYNPNDEISWKLAVTYNSTTGAGSLTPTYNDTETVSSVTFSFYQNASFGEADTLLENQTPAGSGSWTYTKNLASATGNNYYVIITVVKPDGTYTYVSGLAYTFPGPKVLAGVFPADWYFWIAWGAVLCFYAVGTITKKGLFAVFGAAMSIIMVKWGWYSLVFPDIIAYPAIGFTFIVGVVVLLIDREKYA